jgi:hypothetical protein
VVGIWDENGMCAHIARRINFSTQYIVIHVRHWRAMMTCVWSFVSIISATWSGQRDAMMDRHSSCSLPENPKVFGQDTGRHGMAFFVQVTGCAMLGSKA